MKYQSIDITNANIKEIRSIVDSAEDLINNCMRNKVYDGSTDQNYINLIFMCHKLSLRIETYKIEEKINLLNKRNDNTKIKQSEIDIMLKSLDERNAKINEKQKEIEKKQEKFEEQSNNLVYTILGFITSFSIISSAVVAIDNINSMSGILLFMAFTVFLLLTTLIGLHNFYKNNKDSKSKLQNNYFIWRVILFVILLLILYRAIVYVKDNKNEVFEGIGRGIGQVLKNENTLEDNNQK